MKWGSRNPWISSASQVCAPEQQRRTSNASTISSHSTTSFVGRHTSKLIDLPQLDLRTISTYAEQLSTNHAVYKPMVEVFRKVLKHPGMQHVAENPDQIGDVRKAVAERVRYQLEGAPAVPSMDNAFFQRAATEALQQHTAKLRRARIREERKQAELRKIQRGH